MPGSSRPPEAAHPRTPGADVGRAPLWVAVAVFSLVGLALRLKGLDQSLFGDELFTWEISTRASLPEVMAGVRSPLEVTPPGYFVLAWLSHQFVPGFTGIRIPSLLAGLALIPGTYALGRAARLPAAGAVAAGLVAFSPFLVFYSVEARAYSVAALAVTLSSAVLLRASGGPRAYRWWFVFALLTAIALYAHYTVVFVVAAQVAWVLCFRRRAVALLAASVAAAALLFVPWLPEFGADRAAPGSWIISYLNPLSPLSVVSGIREWFSGVPFAPRTVVPGYPALLLDFAGGALALAGGAIAVARRRRPDDEVALVAFVGVLAPAGLVLYSVVGTSIFMPRNLIVSLPAALLLLAAGALVLPGWWKRVAVACLLGGALGGGLATLRPEGRRLDFKGAGEIIAREATGRDVVVDGTALFATGPPADQLKVVLTRPGEVVPLGPGATEAAAREARAAGGRIFVVTPQVGPLVVPIPVPGYRLQRSRILPGLVGLAVREYVRD